MIKTRHPLSSKIINLLISAVAAAILISITPYGLITLFFPIFFEYRVFRLLHNEAKYAYNIRQLPSVDLTITELMSSNFRVMRFLLREIGRIEHDEVNLYSRLLTSYGKALIVNSHDKLVINDVARKNALRLLGRMRKQKRVLFAEIYELRQVSTNIKIREVYQNYIDDLRVDKVE